MVIKHLMNEKCQVNTSCLSQTGELQKANRNTVSSAFTNPVSFCSLLLYAPGQSLPQEVPSFLCPSKKEAECQGVAVRGHDSVSSRCRRVTEAHTRASLRGNEVDLRVLPNLPPGANTRW